MKDGKCPKCGSDEVYRGMPDPRAMFAITTFNFATPTHYVCAACGYLESYIEDQSRLAKIAEKWQRTSA